MLILMKMTLALIHFKQCKAFKKVLNKELMPVTWHPTKGWDGMPEDEKKRNKSVFLLKELV